MYVGEFTKEQEAHSFWLVEKFRISFASALWSSGLHRKWFSFGGDGAMVSIYAEDFEHVTLTIHQPGELASAHFPNTS